MAEEEAECLVCLAKRPVSRMMALPRLGLVCDTSYTDCEPGTEMLQRMVDKWSADGLEFCACGAPYGACPVCKELVCLRCEDWRYHHSLRGRFSRWRWHRFNRQMRWLQDNVTHRRYREA